jgi:hypothetical protein
VACIRVNVIAIRCRSHSHASRRAIYARSCKWTSEIPLPRTRVNRGKNEGRSPTLQLSSYSVSTSGDIIDDSLDRGRGAP